jgi:hypothetical protein
MKPPTIWLTKMSNFAEQCLTTIDRVYIQAVKLLIKH